MRYNDGVVDKDQSEDQEQLGGADVQVWLAGAMPSITALMAAADETPGVLARDSATIRAVADRLDAASSTARGWLSGHPCPDPALGLEFARVFDEFLALAEEYTAASNIPGGDPEDLDERAGQVVADLMLAMYDTRPRES